MENSNRKIAFRAWGVNTKEFYDEDFSVSGDGKAIFTGEGDAYDVPGEFILMQFTGLLDKNGKEIYEGDVVRMSDTKYQVKYVHAEFRLSNLESGNITNSWGLSDQHRMKLEIIGNVYEHPNLLANLK